MKTLFYKILTTLKALFTFKRKTVGEKVDLLIRSFIPKWFSDKHTYAIVGTNFFHTNYRKEYFTNPQANQEDASISAIEVGLSSETTHALFSWMLLFYNQQGRHPTDMEIITYMNAIYYASIKESDLRFARMIADSKKAGSKMYHTFLKNSDDVEANSGQPN